MRRLQMNLSDAMRRGLLRVYRTGGAGQISGVPLGTLRALRRRKLIRLRGRRVWLTGTGQAEGVVLSMLDRWERELKQQALKQACDPAFISWIEERAWPPRIKYRLLSLAQWMGYPRVSDVRGLGRADLMKRKNLGPKTIGLLLSALREDFGQLGAGGGETSE